MKKIFYLLIILIVLPLKVNAVSIVLQPNDTSYATYVHGGSSMTFGVARSSNYPEGNYQFFVPLGRKVINDYYKLNYINLSLTPSQYNVTIPNFYFYIGVTNGSILSTTYSEQYYKMAESIANEMWVNFTFSSVKIERFSGKVSNTCSYYDDCYIPYGVKVTFTNLFISDDIDLYSFFDNSLIYTDMLTSNTNITLATGPNNVEGETTLSNAELGGIIIKNQDKNTQEIIDNQNKNQQETNERLDEINKGQQETNDFLKDDTPPEADISGLGNVQGLLPPGPVDSLLNIPFNFLSIVTSSFGGVCVPISGNFVLNQPLTIPCFGEMIYKEVPDGVMVFLELVPTTFMLITYFKHLYKKVSRAVSLETTGDDEWGVL